MTTRDDEDQATEPDLEAVRAKYREERDRRMDAKRGEFVAPDGAFSSFEDDPYTERVERDPVTDRVEIVVIGAGWAGLLTGAYLRRAGFSGIRVIEKAGDVGGVWYWNRYPGAMCDVQSYVYLPMLEEVGYMPERKYSYAEEIYAYAQKFADHFALRDDALFHTGVDGLTWDEESASWFVETDRGDQITATYVVICNGSFANLKLPAIPGIEAFGGKAFHTSRWDYDYTGGAAHEFLDRLGDKRVGIIGTGATAVQVVPALAESAERLFVFQRTPSTVGERNNALTDHGKMGSLEPGWQAKWRDNFTDLVSGVAQDVDYVDDGWTYFYRKAFIAPGQKASSPEELARERELADFARMEEIRGRIAEVVADPSTATALQPQYRYMCKRPCFHDEYLPSFNLPSVTLVDTGGAGVERVTERGVVVGGTEIELDCLIFATGFDQESLYTDRVGFDVTGRGGQRLSDKWRDGVSTYHGLMTRGFPNLIIAPTNNMQSAVSVNFVDCIERNSEHMAYLLATARDRGLRTFEASAAAEAEWGELITAGARLSAPFLQECTPSRWNNEGHLDQRALCNANFPGPPKKFFMLMQEWREDGTLKGLDVEQTVETFA